MLKRNTAKTESKFKYQPRTTEQLNKRASQSGGMRDSFVSDEFTIYSPKEGDIKLRILPPTWSDSPEHWGFDVYVHYQVGPDNAAYLCLNKMKGEDCPLCEERIKAEKEGEADYAKQLAPTKRVLVWMIDRKNEDAGPLVWAMPWTIDRDICKLSMDDSGEIIYLDDPDNGYDILFSKEGQGQKTKYIGMQVSRRSTPIGKDQWIDYVIANPLPNVLHYYEYDYIKNIFVGKITEHSEESGTETPPWDAKPVTHKEPAKESSMPKTKAEVLAMSDDDLIKLALEVGMTETQLDTVEFEEVVEVIVSKLGLNTPEEAKPEKLSYKDKIKKLREDAK